MSVKKVLLVIAVIVGVVAYQLYTPIPDGYCLQSSLKLQSILMTLKVVDTIAYAGSLVGIGSFVDNNRQIIRFLMQYMHAEPDPNVKETDAVFDGVPVRIYEPVNRNGVLPGIVYYHGGGFTYGSPNMTAGIQRRLCTEVNAVVVSVDYRLAPEAIFPAAYEDCVAATKYFMKNAKQFHVDPNRIAVAGDSAGGNLAAVVSLKLRDDQFQPAIKMQVLIYPVVQGLNFQLPSMIQNHNGPLLTRYMMAFFTSMYLNGNTDNIEAYLRNDHVAPRVKKTGFPFLDVNRLPSKYLIGYEKPSTDTGDEKIWEKMKDKLLNVYYSPLAAGDLSNLPMAYVFTAEHDPLRDEGMLYVYRLKESGVRVEHAHSDIAIHAIMSLVSKCVEAETMFEHMRNYISTNL